MARNSKSGVFKVRVDGLSELAEIPDGLDRGQRILLERGSQAIRDDIRKKAPGGSLGTPARAVQAGAISSTRAVIGSFGFDGARALEKGAYIVPGGQTRVGSAGLASRVGALKFRDGTYSKSARIPAHRYFEKGLRFRSRRIREAFHDGFNDLRRQPAVSSMSTTGVSL